MFLFGLIRSSIGFVLVSVNLLKNQLSHLYQMSQNQKTEGEIIAEMIN